MYSKLEMRLKGNLEISNQMASAFHGALMELLPEEYAEELHESKLHPYAQHLERRAGDWYWIVTALNERASAVILRDTLLRMEGVDLKKHETYLSIDQRNYQELSEAELAKVFYEGDSGRYISIRFVTPTAFKRNGQYMNYPDLRSIYSNLMNKYDASNEQDSMKDEDTLEQLVQNTVVARYRLHSTVFCLEGVRIPAFAGEMTLRIGGNHTMCNFARMLFRFGEYSGIGIKTSLGMGAIELVQDNKELTKNGRQTNQADHRQSPA